MTRHLHAASGVGLTPLFSRSKQFSLIYRYNVHKSELNEVSLPNFLKNFFGAFKTLKYKICRKKLTVKLKVIGTLRPTDSPIKIFMILRSCFLCFLGWVCPTPSPFNKKTKTKTCLHDDEKKQPYSYTPAPSPGSDKIQKWHRSEN